VFKNLNIITIVLLFTFNSHAESPTRDELSLTLICNISFSDAKALENNINTDEIRLSAEKHKRGGAKLIHQNNEYEFWVMTHGVQTMGNEKFINSFQVAVKHKKSKIFSHALSDRSFSAIKQPKYARISLVEYYPDSLLEQNEVLFECENTVLNSIKD
jgi:hypothetical protein